MNDIKEPSRYSLCNVICSKKNKELNKTKYWANILILTFIIITCILLIVSVGAYIGYTHTEYNANTSIVGIVFGVLGIILSIGAYWYNNKKTKLDDYIIDDTDIFELRKIKADIRDYIIHIDGLNSEISNLSARINIINAKNSIVEKSKTTGNYMADLGSKIYKKAAGDTNSKWNFLGNAKLKIKPFKNYTLQELKVKKAKLIFERNDTKNQLDTLELKCRELKIIDSNYNKALKTSKSILSDIINLKENYNTEYAESLKEKYKSIPDDLKIIDDILKGNSLSDAERVELKKAETAMSIIYDNIIDVIPEYIKNKNALLNLNLSEQLTLAPLYTKYKIYVNKLISIEKEGRIEGNLFFFITDITNTIQTYEANLDEIFNERISELNTKTSEYDINKFLFPIMQEIESKLTSKDPFIINLYTGLESLSKKRIEEVEKDTINKENTERVRIANEKTFLEREKNNLKVMQAKLQESEKERLENMNNALELERQRADEIRRLREEVEKKRIDEENANIEASKPTGFRKALSGLSNTASQVRDSFREMASEVVN